MSSIYGYTGDKEVQKQMSDALRHWQPNRENVFHSNEITLGALELYKTPECPLIPQPYVYKEFTIVADCRIDNREELSREFGISDISKHSDIEFIARAFEKYREEAPKHLIGDFAFVVWDELKKQIFAATDHYGVRTLYYSLVNNAFVFASEIKGILAYPEFKKEFNEAYVISEFSALQIPKQDTFYKHLFLLTAGNYLIYKNGKIEVKQYYILGDRKVSVPSTVLEQEAEFNRLAVQSVRVRLRSYKKIGAEVSGGLDSTGIAAVAMELLGKGHPFYSYCYGKPDFSVSEHDQKDDTHIVRELCVKYGIEQYFTIVNESNLNPQELLKVMCEVYDDVESNGVPLFTASFLPHAQKNDVGIMLSGWAGDQVVTNTCGGFPEPLAHERRYLELWNDIYRRHSFWGSVARFGYIALKCWNPKGFYNVNLKKQREQLKHFPLKKEYIAKYHLDQLPGLRFELKSCTDIQTYRLRNFTHKGIQKRTCDHVLMGKHFGIDYRFPMIDLRLVEYINSLPFSTVAPRGKTRYLYQKFVAPFVPQELIRVHKSRVPTTPFAFAYMKANLPYFKEQFKTNNQGLFSDLVDSSYINDDGEKANHREYLRMYFFAKKMRYSINLKKLENSFIFVKNQLDMDLNQKIARSDNFVFNEVDGELVMMNIETGAYASLNETGKSIWTLLDSPKSVAEVVSSLVEEYEIDQATCEKEVLPFVENMLNSDVLVKA
ncbi:MAG: PqqD family peptide modification chaperone [Flavobacteriales bacterium]